MDLLQPGQKLSINIQKNDKLIEIIATISDILDDRLIIELPPYFMRYVEYLDVGRKLTVKVFSKIGTIDFSTVVITSPLEDDDFSIEYDKNVYKLTPESEVPSINAIENIYLKRDDIEIRARTIEISTEYMKISCYEELNVDENLSCELILPFDYGTILFKATVVERDIIYDNEYKLIYYSMNEHDRQALLYYMYVYENDSNQE